ncbi:hypothetical protein J2X76_003626 [Neorhizobium sp. 2083]|uniref:DUF968 domain-containing protein n=1 Tax=Neorhizobium sp. 2083 TaxID=2817762 RepID=UPI0028594C16|nr:DUF968 domain-containing protein [Neorhizobium sp. 2083]MDR6818449.1 hypothetical protein [Neorhizobium sp. 2083]
MTAFRIAHHAASPAPTPKAKAVKSKGYLAFLHELPCAVSGVYGVEAAHLSMAAPKYGHWGRGKGSKAPDRWALPLSPAEHARQHNIGEEAFWRAAGINPHVLALTIFGLWSDMGDDAQPFAAAIVNQHLAASNRLRERDSL